MMGTKLKIFLSMLLIMIVILGGVFIWKDTQNYCGTGKNTSEWNANPDCVCPTGQLKRKFIVMCDPISCPPFYKCIDKEECKPEGHYKIVNGECIDLPIPGCGWPDDYIETNITCHKSSDCTDINPFFICCTLNEKCLDFTPSGLREHPYLCETLGREECTHYPEYCSLIDEECRSK